MLRLREEMRVKIAGRAELDSEARRMKLLLLPMCAVGMHRRDRDSVFRERSHYRSICAGCGAPMVRTDRWRVDKEPPA